MAAKKSAASTAWKVFLGVFLTVIAVALLAEFGLRWFLSSQMTKQFAAHSVSHTEGDGATGADPASEESAKPDVSFGAFPLTLGMLTGEIPQMHISTPSTLSIKDGVISGQPAAEVDVKGMKLSKEPVARELVTTASLPEEFLLATIQRGIAQQSGYDALGDVVITEIATNSASESVDIDFAGGLFKLTLVPEARDGQLTFTATSSKVLAWELPEEVTQQISSALTAGMQSQLAGQSDLRFDDITVLDGELKMTLSGRNINLNEMGQQYGELGAAVQENTPDA
ncbi:hypothetical protein CPHO_01375 [Corynebacterium phocae]|uniref:DUF2993 domain-containing protein n=1 Tax=Corynebacterium phocae TaxID=161895 RepID=A0A1L7D113_9CORY|nr:DUF2993 domain-containing protein [Corynebacterium phocae]APT91788.1 hypothetical protein CPHO_01375 [Corynebacterium phocae]KAA8728457.1 DUF2993 domain-containing protein [Corynebacterium phocae]